MKDANLINISDLESESSTLTDLSDLSDQLDNLNNNLNSDSNHDNLTNSILTSNSNEFKLLGKFLNSDQKDRNEEDNGTDEFKRNLDLNLKKKKRIFLSSDRTDFLNFILAEQQNLNSSSNHNPFLTNSSSNQPKCNSNKSNVFRLTNLTLLNRTSLKHKNYLSKELKNSDYHARNHSDADDEGDLNSESNLLLNNDNSNFKNELSSSGNLAEFADDEDDGLNYLDHHLFIHNSTKRKFRRFYNYFLSFFNFRPHVDQSNNLNNYLLNRINQRPLTSTTSSLTTTFKINNDEDEDEDVDEEEVDDLYFDTDFTFSRNKNSNFFRKLKNSFLNLTYYLNLNSKSHQNNKNYNYFKNKHSTAERIDLLTETTSPSQETISDDAEGWYSSSDGIAKANVRLLSKNAAYLQNESLVHIMVQVFIPFLIAGFGTVGAGLVLDSVQHWKVFQSVSEVFILVPALLGLKGNLEMTLASRLSTQANLGNLNTFGSQMYMASGNLALIQCQATVVGFLAALFAIAVNWLPNADFNLEHAFLLCASSLLTAGLASFVLGVIMIIVVILSLKLNINPDNISTPLAASLGDLTTLGLLAYISNFLFKTIDKSVWFCALCILTMLALIPVWCIIAHRNRFTRQVLYSGWTPVVTAMAISSFGGCILDFAVSRFKGIAVFQPVINGVGGNLVAVQASRISTFLHQRHRLGELDKKESDLCLSPYKTFFANNIHAKTAKVLLLLVIPGHLIFIQGIKFLQAGHTSITPIFLQFYLIAALIQVFILLYIAQIMIFWMWKKKIDPDNSAIPYLTSLGDLIGTGLLSITFYLLFLISDADEDVGE